MDRLAIQDMEDVSAGALPDLIAFLPRWAKRLGRFRPSKDEWETNQERWLREVAFRMEGIEGLARLARKTRRPHVCLAWCQALADRGDWPGALRAYDASAALVSHSHWRGELLDGAALAAQQLGRSDRASRLAAAWRAAPSLRRLVRWLEANGRSPAVVRAKATKALRRCSTAAGRQVGLLRVLLADWRSAADLLSKAAGLGWSTEDHPAHVLFPSFAILLATKDSTRVSDPLLANLESTCRDPLEALSPDDIDGRPKLSQPSIIALIQDVSSSIELTDADRTSMLDAMRIAAEKRVEGILEKSRRRYYGHAALLAATCVAFAPKARARDFANWIAGLRRTYSRRHAFTGELTRALESLGLPAVFANPKA